MAQPLVGLRVLELGRVVAAPFCCQLLGDFGAEVIKLERPGSGDDARQYGPSFFKHPNGTTTSGFYLAFNRNKKSVSVDLSCDEGRDLVRDLAARSDVLVENFKAGDLERRGLGYADLAESNPGLVYCSITGFGQTGPYAAYPAVDMVFQAMSGLMSVTGEPNGAPQKSGVAIADLICGLYAANAIQAALRARDKNGGRGRHIDMALLDCTVSAVSHRAMDYFITGETPLRGGNVAPGTAPAQLFRCRDGVLNVQAGTDRQFALICGALALPEILEDPRFLSGPLRLQHREVLVPMFERILAEGMVADWYAKLTASGVICSPVYDVPQTFQDPQVQSRGLGVTVEGPAGESLQFLRNPIRVVGQPEEPPVFPPAIGEHTDDVLSAVLGLSAGRLADLRAAGVV